MGESCCSIPKAGEPDTERAEREGAGLEPESAERCPACSGDGPSVEPSTVAAMTRARVARKQAFRLCRERDCEVVYYGDRGARFTTEDLHVVPGFKTAGPEGLVCYCFLHTRGEIEQELRETGETTVPRRITEEIRAGNCACEVRNPAGRCCLGEVNDAVASVRERLLEVVK